MKILHTADSQLKNWSYGGINPKTGFNRRFEDVLDCFDFIIDRAICEKVDFFIHAGDVNEERNPEVLAIDEFSKRIQRLIEADIKIIITAGNHDIDSSIGTSTSISYLKSLKLPDVYIADKEIEIFEFEKINFLCLPYFTKAQLGYEINEEIVELLKKNIKKFLKKYKSNTSRNICVMHYSTDEIFKGLEINEPIIPIKFFEKFDYTAMGHIHKYKMYDDIGVIGGYSGSPYKVNFGENHLNYFNIVDFNQGAINKIEIPNRDFVEIIIDAKEADSTNIEDFVLQKIIKMNLENKFLKIIVQCYKSFNCRKIYEYLKSQNIFHYLPIKFDKVRVVEETRFQYKQGMSSVEIVKKFLEKQKLKKDFKNNVFKETVKIIEMVEI